MDQFVKHTSEQQGLLPREYVVPLTAQQPSVSAPPRRPQHNLFDPSESDTEKIYDWDKLSEDAAFTAKLKDLYSMYNNDTDLCIFPWEIRQSLGKYFVPTKASSAGLLAQGTREYSLSGSGGGNGNNKWREVLARVIVEYARSLAMREPEPYGFLEEWARAILENRQLEPLYREMDVKQSRERQIYLHHKRFQVRPAPSVTLYTSERPKPAKQRTEPIATSDQQQREPLKPAHHSRESKREDEENEDDGQQRDEPLVVYRNIERTVRDLRREKESLEALDAALDQSDHDRYYHTLSMSTFSKCLLGFWVLSLPLCVVCQDPWAILLPGVVAVVLGVWSYLLSTIVASYRSLDLFMLTSMLLTIALFVYLLLRSFLYNAMQCSSFIEDIQLFLLWIVWLFVLMLFVFSTTLAAIRKRIKGWNVFRLMPLQKTTDKQK